jgi:hypothetical protein
MKLLESRSSRITLDQSAPVKRGIAWAIRASASGRAFNRPSGWKICNAAVISCQAASTASA